MNHSQELLIYTTLMFSNENCSHLLEQGQKKHTILHVHKVASWNQTQPTKKAN